MYCVALCSDFSRQIRFFLVCGVNKLRPSSGLVLHNRWLPKQTFGALWSLEDQRRWGSKSEWNIGIFFILRTFFIFSVNFLSVVSLNTVSLLASS